MCTIKDFFNFCDNKKIKYNRCLALSDEKVLSISKNNIGLRNFFSDLGIFLIEK